jgi:hypothetical protein
MQELQNTAIASEFVGGLTYPIAKADAFAAAREAKLPEPILQALAALPERDYADADDLTHALNAG